MKLIKNLFYLFFPLIGGSIIGLISSKFMDYNSLVKPPLSPPGLAFPIVWTILYLLLGLSFYLYKQKKNNTLLNIIYYIGLFVNYFWTVFFFILKWRLFTCLWTIILLALVIYLILLFFKENKISSYLNIPYLLWVLFATYLTFGTYFLNI